MRWRNREENRGEAKKKNRNEKQLRIREKEKRNSEKLLLLIFSIAITRLKSEEYKINIKRECLNCRLRCYEEVDPSQKRCLVRLRLLNYFSIFE